MIAATHCGGSKVTTGPVTKIELDICNLLPDRASYQQSSEKRQGVMGIL